MQKNKIYSQYYKIILIIFIISMIISFLTPIIIKAFTIELMGEKISEIGLDYVIKQEEPKEELENLLGNYIDSNSAYADIIKILCLGMLILPLVFALIIKLCHDSKQKNTVIKMMLTFITVNLILSTLYFFICVFNLEDYVQTQSYIPFIVQLLLCFVGFFMWHHCKQAILGIVKPLFIFSDGTVKSARGEIDKADLIIKYKELLDKNIISEEEFEKKLCEFRAENSDEDELSESPTEECKKTLHLNSPLKLKWHKFLFAFWIPFEMFFTIGFIAYGINTVPAVVVLISTFALILLILQNVFLIKRKKSGITLTYISCFFPIVFCIEAAFMDSSLLTQNLSTFLVLSVGSLYVFCMNLIYFGKRKDLFN